MEDAMDTHRKPEGGRAARSACIVYCTDGSKADQEGIGSSIAGLRDAVLDGADVFVLCPAYLPYLRSALAEVRPGFSYREVYDMEDVLADAGIYPDGDWPAAASMSDMYRLGMPLHRDFIPYGRALCLSPDNGLSPESVSSLLSEDFCGHEVVAPPDDRWRGRVKGLCGALDKELLGRLFGGSGEDVPDREYASARASLFDLSSLAAEPRWYMRRLMALKEAFGRGRFAHGALDFVSAMMDVRILEGSR